jgi:hypothetical protein
MKNSRSNSYQEKILKDRLKKDVIQKLFQIKENIERETPCSYGASYEQNLTIISEDLDDILLNWKD